MCDFCEAKKFLTMKQRGRNLQKGVKAHGDADA